MEKLYDLTLSQAANLVIEKIVEDKGVSKAMAKKLFTNAIVYNVVIYEIENQIDFLLGIDEDEG